MLPELNAIVLEEHKDKFILATYYHGVWTCRMCDFTETSRTRTLRHIRMDHITFGNAPNGLGEIVYKDPMIGFRGPAFEEPI